jgi:hypothetical protein
MGHIRVSGLASQIEKQTASVRKDSVHLTRYVKHPIKILLPRHTVIIFFGSIVYTKIVGRAGNDKRYRLVGESRFHPGQAILVI